MLKDKLVCDILRRFESRQRDRTELLPDSRLYFNLFEQLWEWLMNLVCHHGTIVSVLEAPHPSGKLTSHTLKTLKLSSPVLGPTHCGNMQ